MPSVQDVKEEVREMSTKNLKLADVQYQTFQHQLVLFVYNKSISSHCHNISALMSFLTEEYTLQEYGLVVDIILRL